MPKIRIKFGYGIKPLEIEFKRDKYRTNLEIRDRLYTLRSFIFEYIDYKEIQTALVEIVEKTPSGEEAITENYYLYNMPDHKKQHNLTNIFNERN